MIIVGIDPGKSGGIAIDYGEPGVAAIKMPEEADLYRVLSSLSIYGEEVRVFIENIPKWCGSAQFARRNIFGASMATLYGSYKFAHGLCVGLGFTTEVIAPVKWQNAVGCRNTDKEDKTAWKNKLKDRAKELYPWVKVTLATADALLIMEAGAVLKKLRK